MAVTDFIAAIELGSTKITGLAGKKKADGSIEILAHASERSSDSIKKGVIYNSDKTLQCLNSIIRKLEEQLGASIKKAYIGIGGKSMYSIENYIFRQFNDETKISQALIDSMLKANREMELGDKEIQAVEPQEYKIGNDLRTDPVGISTKSIEGHYVNIIARRSLKDKIKQCASLAKIGVAGYLISPIATANSALTSDEKRSGCALVDLGAETTTVVIYKNNILRYLAVIPLGSNNITKDICSQLIDEEDAEQLKIRFARAYTEISNENSDSDEKFVLNDKTSIKAQLLEEIVEARVNEIIANVDNQIKRSKSHDKLLAGIIITGGGANMPNMDEAFRKGTQFDKIRFAKKSEIPLDGIKLPEDGTYNTIIGLLAGGKDNCCKVEAAPNLLFHGTGSDLKSSEELAEQKKKEENLKKCSEYLEEVKELITQNKYEQAQERLQHAAEMQIEEKRNEIEKLREELAEKKQRQEKIRKCEKYLEEARELIAKNKDKQAQELLERAIEMQINEKQEEIEELKEKISEKPKDNIFTRWKKHFEEQANRISKDLMD